MKTVHECLLNSDTLILGIETSCDDTAIALCKNEKVLAKVRISQHEMCQVYGGVVPDLAARNHFSNLNIAIEEVLIQSGIKMENIDVIACTIGPGLIGSLIVASSFARYLCKLTNKIFVPVHHIEAHIDVLNMKPPYIAVVISGGHSQIIYCSEIMNAEILCDTRDDSFGELIDKVGRALGLEIPSGAIIEKIAINNTIKIEKKDIIIALRDELSFSCSGLKTHFLNLINTNLYTKEYICDLLQQTIGVNLDIKIKKVLKITNCNNVIVCGGVSANKYIRSVLNYCQFAPIDLCTDNGVMIAMSAIKHLRNNSSHINKYDIEEFSSMSLTEWYKTINL